MCNKEPQDEAPAFEISRGAAMAHGCCGGFRMPQPKAVVIPINADPDRQPEIRPDALWAALGLNGCEMPRKPGNQ